MRIKYHRRNGEAVEMKMAIIVKIANICKKEHKTEILLILPKVKLCAGRY